MLRLHGVIVGADTVSGVPFLKSLDCDSCRVRIERAVKGAEVVVPRRKTFYGADEIGVREPGGNAVIFGQHASS